MGLKAKTLSLSLQGTVEKTTLEIFFVRVKVFLLKEAEETLQVIAAAPSSLFNVRLRVEFGAVLLFSV